MLPFLIIIKDEHSQSKLEVLYMKYKEDMYDVAFRILKDYHLAQDAVQSAFLRLSKSLNKMDGFGCNQKRAFIVIVVRNISIDMYRKRKKQNDIFIDEIDNVLPDDGKQVEEIVMDFDMVERAIKKLTEMNPTYSDIIALKYYYGYSDNEIANLLNITPENVRVRLHRAKQSLYKLLSQDEVNQTNEREGQGKGNSA